MSGDGRLDSLEILVRQSTATQAGLAAGVEAIKDTLVQVQSDAREARDGVTRISTSLGEQNVPGQLAAIRAEIKSGNSEMRVDLVHAISAARDESRKAHEAMSDRVNDLDSRLQALEDDRQRRDGGFTIIRLIKEYGGWLVATGATFLAIWGQLHPHIP